MYPTVPGILLSYPVNPAGVHGKLDAVKLAFFGNVAFYAAVGFGLLSLRGRRLRVRRADVFDTLTALERHLKRYDVEYALRIHRAGEAAASVDDGSLNATIRHELFRGTMGSLSDLIISRQNGNRVDDEVAANHELDRLTAKLWKLVRE